MIVRSIDKNEREIAILKEQFENRSFSIYNSNSTTKQFDSISCFRSKDDHKEDIVFIYLEFIEKENFQLNEKAAAQRLKIQKLQGLIN